MLERLQPRMIRELIRLFAAEAAPAEAVSYLAAISEQVVSAS